MKKGFTGLSEEQNALFTQFWNHYPDHSAKKDAQSAFSDLSPSEELINKIVLAIQERLRFESIGIKKGEKPARWPYPATYLRQARWEDEIGSFTEMRSKPDAGAVKMCECGKPSMFGSSTPLNYCQTCYCDYVNEKRISQAIAKDEQYAAAIRAGAGKRKDETLAEYQLRCKHLGRNAIGSAKGVVGRDSARVAGTPQNSDGVETDGCEAAQADAYLNAHAEYAERQA